MENPQVIPPEDSKTTEENSFKSLLIRISKVLGLIAVGSILVIGIYLVYFFLEEKKIVEEYKKAYESFENLKKAREADRQRPHEEMMAKIEDIRLHGTALQPCPLIFPLLNEKGKVTPLGSFLSLTAMENATYLPQAVFQLSYDGTAFSMFKLFENQPQDQEGYKKQLPYLMATPNFGEGTLIQKKHVYRIHLRFWGTRPEKTYDQVFKKNSLHLASGWMATCLQDWMGFKPNKAEADFVNHPTYKNDEHLFRAVYMSYLFPNSYPLVTRFEQLLADDPDCPCLYPVWIYILDSREGVCHLDMANTAWQNNPQASCLAYAVMYENYSLQKYDEALKICLDNIKQDTNNGEWYGWAAYSLEFKGYWKEAIQLLKNWTSLHPENPSAWLILSMNLRSWGTIPANTNKQAYAYSANEMFSHLTEGYGYAQKCAQIAPEDESAWSELLLYGTLLNLSPSTMEGYFQKAIALHPADFTPYQTYLNYLETNMHETDADLRKFIHQYADQMPELDTDYILQTHVPAWAETVEGQKKQMREEKLSLQDSPDWKEYVKYEKLLLKRNPANLGFWQSYLDWADMVDQQETVFTLAKKYSDTLPELKALYPYLLLAYPAEAAKKYVTNEDKKNFFGNAFWLKRTGWAYHRIAELDPENWHNLNLLAQYDVNNGMKKDARQIFKNIGTHWAPEVWPLVDFNKAKINMGFTN